MSACEGVQVNEEEKAERKDTCDRSPGNREREIV